MCEILLERIEHSQDIRLGCDDGEIAVRPLAEALEQVEADSFQSLLAQLEREPAGGDRSHVIERYHAWIERAGATSKELFAAWFNIGVELINAGDKTGAINAYRNVLAARPGFGPAVFNLRALLASPNAEGEAVHDVLTAAKGGQADSRATMDVLHVGCGVACPAALPAVFRQQCWREVRLDIDPTVEPDFIASITDMGAIADQTADAVYSSHNVEHLYPHEVAVALREMQRVLKPGGFVLIMVPDLQAVAQFVADGKLEETLYVSPMGPIAPLDMLYGHRPSMANGNTFMAHRTGFTCGTLASALIQAGFATALVQRDSAALSLTAVAYRTMPEQDQLERARAEILPPSAHAAILYLPIA